MNAAAKDRESSRWLRAVVAFLALWLGAAGVARAALTADIAVESREVFLGEPFRMQIQVTADGGVQPPDTSAIEDFAVESLPPRNNSSTQISMVNGRVERTVTNQMVFEYRLIAKRSGELRIPSLRVTDGKETVATSAVRIHASEPDPVENITLEAELSRSSCYAGEAVTLTWRWLVGQEVRGFQFQLPVLAAPGFEVPPQSLAIDQARRDHYLQIPLGNGQSMIGIQERLRRGNRPLTVVTFSRVVIPRAPGTHELDPGQVVCEVLAGMQPPTARGQGPGGLFDEFFGGSARRRYRQVAVRAAPLTLDVKPLPTTGRPADFSGIVGRVELQVEADPTEVSVGEPLLLILRVSGPEYLESLDLPPLEKQPQIAAGFKVSDAAPGVVAGAVKVFQRTLRASHAEVTAIPPIRIAYFDTRSESYAVAESAPIALNVKATRVVTARDAEGATPASAGVTLRDWTQGIAHNYEDLTVLVDQHYGLDAWLDSPLWLGTLMGLPGLYVVLVGGTLVVRRRQADPAGRRARRAARQFRRGLSLVVSASDPETALEQLLCSLRGYLGDRLGLPPGALTYPDVEPRLRRIGAGVDTLERLQRLFEVCEAGRYAGASSDASSAELVSQARDVISELERRFR